MGYKIDKNLQAGLDLMVSGDKSKHKKAMNKRHEAMKLINKSAQSGETKGKSYFFIAKILREGLLGFDPDIETSKNYYDAAMGLFDKEVCDSLDHKMMGDYYNYGLGTNPIDKNRALDFYDMAAEEGDEDAKTKAEEIRSLLKGKKENVMNEGQMLKIGETLHCNAGTIRVRQFIGSGGQGEVYRILLNGKEYALKYFFSNCCTPAFKQTIKDLVETDMEDFEYYVWPLYFVENGNQFGYVMNMIPNGYHSITEWIAGRFDMNVDTMLKVCTEICDGFHRIHAYGYSYKDISDANIVINPDTEKILILDNDNITQNLKSAGVKGTPRFMAPELVSGYIKSPNRTTDLYSLAVLLFEILMCAHPLEGNFHGKSETNFPDDDLGLDKEIYGMDTACFIFKDPDNLDRYIDENDSNAKVMWQYYPQRLRDLFFKTFTSGINNACDRPGSEVWTERFLTMLGLLYTCPHCGKPMFFSTDQAKHNNGIPLCKNCGNDIGLPILIVRFFNNRSRYIIINDGKRLYNGFFGIESDNKLDVVLETEYDGRRLRFRNVSRYNVIYKGKTIGYDQWTNYISADDKITVDGREVEIHMNV